MGKYNSHHACELKKLALVPIMKQLILISIIIRPKGLL